MRFFIALALFLITAHARAADPCLSQCAIEDRPDGHTEVVCSCKEKKRASTAYSLRGATDEEKAAASHDECKEREDTPLCRCVRAQRAYGLRKSCEATGAGERICRFLPEEKPLEAARPAHFHDYQVCIANRIGYRRLSCLGDACSQFGEAYDGGGDAAEWKIKIDPQFTPAERAAIETALASIPACWINLFKGVELRKKRLLWKNQYVKMKGKTYRLFACEAGLAQLYGTEIKLDPYCGITVGVVVHELFHLISERGGLRPRWMEQTKSLGKCPVTSYGAHSPIEDFAEAGRLLFYPKGDDFAEPKNDGACVDAKIQALGKLLGGCGN